MTEHMTGSAPEEWRDVPSFPGFEASSWGRVRCKPYKAIMHHGGERWYGGIATYGTTRKRDRRRVLNIWRLEKQVYVSRMVCEAFHGQAPEGKPLVMHADDDVQNNRQDNLSWGTNQENMSTSAVKSKMREAWAAGTYYGKVSKLFPEQVVAIRERLSSGEKNTEIAKDFGVDPSIVSHIKSRRLWPRAEDLTGCA